MADRQEEPATEAGRAWLIDVEAAGGTEDRIDYTRARIIAIERQSVPAPLDVEWAINDAYRQADDLDSNHARWVIQRLAGSLGLTIEYPPVSEPNNRLRDQLAEAQAEIARLSNQPSTEPLPRHSCRQGIEPCVACDAADALLSDQPSTEPAQGGTQ